MVCDIHAVILRNAAMMWRPNVVCLPLLSIAFDIKVPMMLQHRRSRKVHVCDYLLLIRFQVSKSRNFILKKDEWCNGTMKSIAFQSQLSINIEAYRIQVVQRLERRTHCMYNIYKRLVQNLIVIVDCNRRLTFVLSTKNHTAPNLNGNVGHCWPFGTIIRQNIRWL